jgi:ribonuclease P protein component
MSGPARRAPRLPRLAVSKDFERVLAGRSRAATIHFAVHHLAAVASAPRPAPAQSGPDELSTIDGLDEPLPVEDLPVTDLLRAASWIGAVVPKRHARRAVTRSLIKRQIYAASERHRDKLAPGLWIVRLRSPFDRTRFASAASPALRRTARAELDALFAAAADRNPA